MSQVVTKVSIARQYLRRLQTHKSTDSRLMCTLPACNSILSDGKASNLTKHFEQKHAEFFALQLEAANRKFAKSAPDWEKRRLEHIQHLTELITINNRPFSLLSDSGFTKLRSRELAALQEAGHGEGLTGKFSAVMQHIQYLSSEIKSIIKKEVKNLLVSLMVDIGSKNGRDILGISIQYMRNGIVMIRSIGMIQLTHSHTGANVRDEILACLNAFEIKPSQVVSVTSDNASNMLAMVKLLNKESDGEIESEKEMEFEDEMESNAECEEDISLDKNVNIYSDEVIKAEIENALDEFKSVDSMSEDELRDAMQRDTELFELLDDTSHYCNLLKELHNEFILHTMRSAGIKCAAHTLQLAVKNALKSKKVRILIDMCRIACKLLRKTNYKNGMRNRQFKITLPRLDCAVRWNSTYMMVIIFSIPAFFVLKFII